MNHKYGVEIPTNLEHAYRIDEKNGNTLWGHALCKEMYMSELLFEVLEEGSQMPKHLVWDVKMDFICKASGYLIATRLQTWLDKHTLGLYLKRVLELPFALNDLNVFAANI